jgi:two-component system cell cycle response regulator
MTVFDATERRAYEQSLVEARDAERCARVLAEELQERLREANAALQRLASLDALTGVENRRALEQHLQRLTARARRHGALYGVALVDVDHFKAFNDAHGHDAGDAVLQIVAERIRECIREEDVVGRWGGEEFMVLTPDIEPEGVAELAERIRGAIGSAPVWHQGLELGVTVSVGWAAWPDASGEGIVRRADQALYGAKGAGRDRVAAAPAELLAAPA